MPTINIPAGSSTQLELRPAHHYHLRSFAVHAYLGIAVTLVIVTIWRFKPRRRSSTISSANYRSQSDVKDIKGSFGPAKPVRSEIAEVSKPECGLYQVLATPPSVSYPPHSLSSTCTKGPGTFGDQQAMDGHDKGRLSDSSDPESASSRAVSKKPKSASTSRHEAYLWPQANYSASMTRSSTPDQLRKHTPSPKTSGSIDGTANPSSRKGEKGWGKGRLHAPHQMDGIGASSMGSLSYDDLQTQDNRSRVLSLGEPRLHFTRPPPPPPLTPPSLDKTAFALQDRGPAPSASISAGSGISFIHQPNPDYTGHTSSADILSSSPTEVTAVPRRRSYTKSVPIRIPTPSGNPSSSSGITFTTPSAVSLSSCAPSSPVLPPPPPVPQGYQFVGGHMGHRPSVADQHHAEIKVYAEIISVTDAEGDGWRRHTQVYGGGVCLACLANGGGTYGPNVPLEDRRY